MNKETLYSLIRSVLTLAGAFLIGGGLTFFGVEINNAFWDEATGVVLTGFSVYWSIKTRAVNIEILETSVRQILTFVLGILVARQVLTPEKSMAIILFAVGLLPTVLSWISKKKTEELKEGKIQPQQLLTTTTKPK